MLTLHDTTKTVIVGESITLSVESYNGQRDVEWSSANPAIATVSDGVVTGVSAGTVIITATAGSAQDTCMVFVKETASKDEMPTVQLTLEKTELYIEEQTTLQTQLKKDGETLTGVSFEYVVSDENVIELDNNGAITAKKEGKATITVQATWENEIYSKAVTVVVKPDYEVILNQKTLTLDAIAEWKGKAYENTATLTASVLYRGQPTSETVTWTTSDENVAVVENGLIQAKKVGDTHIQASYARENRTYETTALVSVQAAKLGVVNENSYEIPIETKYAFTNLASYKDIPGEVLKVYVAMNGAKYPIVTTSGETSFAIPERFSGKNIEIVVETEQALASYRVSAYISIDNYLDLTMLYEKSSGYYKLTSDIDMTDKTWTYPHKNTFSGMFDGGNHEIKGLRLTGANGLFYEVENEVEIANLKLADVFIDTKETVGALFASDKNAETKLTVENVEADVVMTDEGVNGGLFGTVLGNVSLKNVTVHAYKPSYDTTRGGAIFASLTGKLTTETVKINSALWYTSSKTQPTTPMGLTHALPTVLKSDGKEVRLNFLSNADTYSLQVNATLADSSQIYYPNVIEKSGSGITLQDERIVTMGGKNIEIVAWEGENIGYYYIPIDKKGYLGQSNFHKLPYVTSGEVFLIEDIDFSKVTDWQDIKSVTFTGVFDGQNHKISNFNGRMFYEFCGTAKNFDLVNARTKDAAGYGLVADLMHAGSKLENVSITAKVSHYEKSGVLARYLTDGVHLSSVSIFAISTRMGDAGFLGGFATKGAYVNCKDCLFVVTNDNNSFAPYGIRDGSFINSFEEMGENYSKVLRGTFSLYNSPVDFLDAYKENKLSESHKKIYEEKFQTVIQKEVKEIKTATDLTEMLQGKASYYYLTQDIECSGLDWSKIERDKDTYFQVILEGNEHCIKNLPDYLFYNFQGRLQNVAFTDMQEGASICRVARGGALINVFLHGVGAGEQDGGLFAQEINAYKGSGLYFVLLDNVVFVTTGKPNLQYKQGFIAGYAAVHNTVECNNGVFISKYMPIKIRTDKNANGKFLYVNNLEGKDESKPYDAFLLGTYARYTSANKFEREYTGKLTALNQKYYELTKVLEEEPKPDTSNDGDALIFDSVWTK